VKTAALPETNLHVVVLSAPAEIHEHARGSGWRGNDLTAELNMGRALRNVIDDVTMFFCKTTAA
jgi:hypothetical protein